MILGSKGTSPTFMNGNFAADNLDIDECITTENLANDSFVYWGDTGTLNGSDPDDFDTSGEPENHFHDACPSEFCDAGQLADDVDCDGVDDDGNGTTDDPCNTPEPDPDGCDDNCMNQPNNGANPVGDEENPGPGAFDAKHRFQTDEDDDGIGDACDNCINAFNVSQCDDGDGDRTGDVCDSDNNSYDTLADRDNDGDVDGFDFSFFASCFNYAGNPPRTLGCSAADADAFDFDGDNDVDGVDFSKFASCFNKAGNSPRSVGCPPSRTCRHAGCP